MIEMIGKKSDERQTEDFYATPTEEVENILSRETLAEPILEPCCGMGHMVKGLKNKGYKNIIATDLYERGYGESGLDFLSEDYPYTDGIKSIIINPPFKLIDPFVRKALAIAEDKVILLARLQFLESVGRYENIFAENPPTTVYVYIDRISCAKDGIFKKKMNQSMTYAWFVWDKHSTEEVGRLKWVKKMR